MSALTIHTQSDLLSFIKNNLQGDKTLSIRGLAGLCGVNDRAIIRGADFHSTKLAQKLSEYGFEGADLARNGFPAQAVWLVIEYFAYESKAKAEGAKHIARVFGTVGIMHTFEQLTNQPRQIMPTHAEALRGWADALDEIKVLAPKAEIADAFVLQSEGTITATQMARRLGTSAVKLNAFLRDMGVLSKVIIKPATPNKDYSEWYECKTVECADDRFRPIFYITPLGQVKITELWEENNM